MIEHQKYRRLADRLKSDQPEGNQEEQGNFYFQHLAHLEIDILIAQIEVEENQRQIGALENKIGIVQAETQKAEIENRKIIQSSSQQIPKDHACPLKDCGKRFQKQSGLRLHHQLTHSNETPWMEGALFSLELLEPDV